MHQVVVITGAGSGLGESLTLKFAEQGAHVCLLGRRKARLEGVASRINGPYTVFEVDVASKQEVERVIEQITTTVGPVDILVNNAGTGVFDLAERIQEEDVHSMIDINLKGTIFCTQAVLGAMKERNNGLIVNVVSTAGKQGKVTESVYCASKFGVRGFTESLALELKETSVHVSGVYMGGMKTEFWNGIFTEEQTKNLMDPDDIADIILANIAWRPYLSVEEIVIKNKK